MPLDIPTCSLPRTLPHRIGYGPDPLAPLADALGLSDIDISVVTGSHRRLTQALAAMVYEEGRPTSPTYGGLRYVSRLNRAWECWALFIDRSVVLPQRVIPIAADDPSLHDAARILQLAIEADTGAIVSP